MVGAPAARVRVVMGAGQRAAGRQAPTCGEGESVTLQEASGPTEVVESGHPLVVVARNHRGGRCVSIPVNNIGQGRDLCH